MHDFLDFSSPAASGDFIELARTGVLQNVQTTWDKYRRMRMKLDVIKSRLRLCNDAEWLFKFAKQCRQQKNDFEQELRQLVGELEESRRWLEDECETITSELARIRPSLAASGHAWMPASSLDRRFDFGDKKLPAEVVKRNYVIRSHPDLSSRELCKRLEAEEVRLPEHWQKKLSKWSSWTEAYRHPALRKLIHKMFSHAKRQLR